MGRIGFWAVCHAVNGGDLRAAMTRLLGGLGLAHAMALTSKLFVNVEAWCPGLNLVVVFLGCGPHHAQAGSVGSLWLRRLAARG